MSAHTFTITEWATVRSYLDDDGMPTLVIGDTRTQTHIVLRLPAGSSGPTQTLDIVRNAANLAGLVGYAEEADDAVRGLAIAGGVAS